MTAKIKKEIQAGRIAGPFSDAPFQVFHVSPLGVVPKKNPGEFRLIHHLSYPKGHHISVNDGISVEDSTVTYASIQQAIHIIQRLGRGCYMAKTDIESAFVSYRYTPQTTSYWALLGMANSILTSAYQWAVVQAAKYLRRSVMLLSG